MNLICNTLDNLSISSLCTALEKKSSDCYGCVSNENFRYYIYHLSDYESQNLHLLTLQHILSGQGGGRLTRSQRYSLSLTLSSSFLQLLETPWLPDAWAKSDIFFLADTLDANRYLLDQPYVKGYLSSTSPQKTTPSDTTDLYSHPLDLLGIVLLELCFGYQLDDRQDLAEITRASNGNKLIAALEWHKEVVGETGSDYSQAVAWCLIGHRTTPREKLRQGMFQNVVMPLEKTYSNLFL